MKHAMRFVLGLVLPALCVIPAAQAADAGETAYIVTYFETVPAYSGKARGLLRQLARAARKEAGNLRFEALQRTGQADQFVILEAWKDNDAQAAHAAAARTKEFREKLEPLLRGPYDERPHTALGVAPGNASSTPEARQAAVFVVTHVDIVPKEKDVGVAAVKQLSEDGRKDRGNVRFESLTQVSRPNHMTVVEMWSDPNALQAHGAAAHKKAFREKLMPMSGSLYDERFYKAVD